MKFTLTQVHLNKIINEEMEAVIKETSDEWNSRNRRMEDWKLEEKWHKETAVTLKMMKPFFGEMEVLDTPLMDINKGNHYGLNQLSDDHLEKISVLGNKVFEDIRDNFKRYNDEQTRNSQEKVAAQRAKEEKEREDQAILDRSFGISEDQEQEKEGRPQDWDKSPVGLMLNTLPEVLTEYINRWGDFHGQSNIFSRVDASKMHADIKFFVSELIKIRRDHLSSPFDPYRGN